MITIHYFFFSLKKPPELSLQLQVRQNLFSSVHLTNSRQFPDPWMKRLGPHASNCPLRFIVVLQFGLFLCFTNVHWSNVFLKAFNHDSPTISKLPTCFTSLGHKTRLQLDK